MLVACNGRNEEWCPYGSKDCECDIYYPHTLKENENRYHSCTDINWEERDCYLEEVTLDNFVSSNSNVEIRQKKKIVDRNKVFKGLDCCKEFLCDECPYQYLDDKEYPLRCIHTLIVDLSEIKEELGGDTDDKTQ